MHLRSFKGGRAIGLSMFKSFLLVWWVVPVNVLIEQI